MFGLRVWRRAGDGRGNLRVAKTPPLQSALRGDRWGDYHPRPPFTPRRQQRERRRWITMRHAASLRPSRNGRIGFKPPYSKRGTLPKGPCRFNLLWRGLSPLAMKKISITHLQLFEDRSDAACRVVLKPRVHGGMRVAWYAHTVALGRACAYGGRAFVATWRAASRLGAASL